MKFNEKYLKFPILIYEFQTINRTTINFVIQKLQLEIHMFIRGLFKKFCYKRLSIRKDNVCLTDFVHKYSSFFHTCTSEISNESSKYQYSYWHLKWRQSYTLAYIWRWKGGKRWTRRCLSYKKSCCNEKICPKKGWGTNFWE